jgi:Putative adhesin
MSKTLFRLTAASMFVILTSVLAGAQDFQKKYEIGAGGHINVSSVSGNVKVTGYDGSVVMVTAVKEGRDRDMVEVEDTSGGDRVELRSRYAPNCNCNASINFTVQVPRSVKYSFDKISTASGDIEVRNVMGELRVRSASGDVTVEDVSGSINASSASGDVRVKDASGTVNASAASGDVDVEMTRVEGAENMEFTSASGDVHVKAPASLDATVDMSSVNGSLKTDFPLEVKEPQYGSRRSAHGRLGNGSRSLKIRSASGDVSLIRL